MRVSQKSKRENRGDTLMESVIGLIALSAVVGILASAFNMNSRFVYDTARHRLLDETLAEQAATLKAVPITKLFNGGNWDVAVVQSDGTTRYQTTNDLFLNGAVEGVWFARPAVRPDTNSQPFSVQWRFAWEDLNHAGAGRILNLDAMVWRNGMTNVVRVSRCHEFETLP